MKSSLVGVSVGHGTLLVAWMSMRMRGVDEVDRFIVSIHYLKQSGTDPG